MTRLLRLLARLLLAMLVRLLRSTWRVRFVREPGPGARLLAVWHGDQLALTCLPRPLTALVSRSSDGGLAASVLAALGFDTVRGSSSSGAVSGALGLVRRLRAGSSVAVAVDGPRGPRHLAGDAVIRLAQAGGAAVVPVAACPRRGLRLASWDRFVIPAPFTRVYVVWGAAIDHAVEPALHGVWIEARELAGTRRTERAVVAARGR